MRRILILLLAVILVGGGAWWWFEGREQERVAADWYNGSEVLGEQDSQVPPSIEQMRAREYPGSELLVEGQFSTGAGYERYRVSFESEGLKEYGLLAVPTGEAPEGGWPVIVMVHDYMPPQTWSASERYETYVDWLAKSGYIVLLPDLRGHDLSEGNATEAYFDEGYTADVLNAVASVKRYFLAGDKVGLWGHGAGGFVVARAMVVSKQIGAGVIWGGAVVPYEKLFKETGEGKYWRPSEEERLSVASGKMRLETLVGSYEENSGFWRSLSPVDYLGEISGPVQLHHGLSDEVAPWEFSQSLYEDLRESEWEVDFYKHEGGGHNLDGEVFEVAMGESVNFFDKYLR